MRKLVLASVSYTNDGFHPGLLEGIEQMTPEAMVGSPFEQEYARLAPDPAGWAGLIAKTKQLDGDLPELAPEVVSTIAAPVPGGVIGDIAGLPDSQLAILPGTTHVTLPSRTDLLPPMITAFLLAA